MLRLPMLGRVLRQLFQKPATNQFPAAHLPPSVTRFLESVAEGKATLHPPVPVPQDYKGKIAYLDENACSFCGLCAKVCPAAAIMVDKKTSKLIIYTGHCIQCAQCTEVCAKKMLVMTDEFLTATTNRYAPDMILGKF